MARQFAETRRFLRRLDQPANLGELDGVCSTSDGWSGLQRLQGRNPAISASFRLAWKRTFSGRGSRAAHDGRQ